jgi:gliding motility-associated-like protein
MTASRKDSVCMGENILMYASGAATYTWSPDVTSLNNLNNYVSASPSISTTYFVTGTDAHRCFSVTKEIPVTVFPIPTVEAGADKTISAGRSVELTPVVSSDVNNVIWSPTTGTLRSSYPSITVKPRETTEYTVEVSNAGGCAAKDKITVFVTCDGANIFIPNTFSPNGDGMNDIFYPRGSGIFNIRSMKLFNRWGEMIYQRANFKPNDISAGWDGTFRRQALNSDVYVYVVEVICDNDTPLIFKGNVTLVK